MTIIRVGIHDRKSETVEIDKPYDEIRTKDILVKGVLGHIVGWIDVEEETRQSWKQLYEQSDRIDELKAESRQLKLTIARQQATNADIERDSRDTNVALNESRKIVHEYHKKYNSLVGILTAVKEQLEAEVCEVERLRFVVGREHTECKKLQQRIDEKDMLIKCLESNARKKDTQQTRATIKILRKERDECKESAAEKSSLIDELFVNLHNCKCDKGQLKAYTNGLEEELAICREDSEVLKKIVDIVSNDEIQTYIAIDQLTDLLVDYLDVKCEGCGKRCPSKELLGGVVDECSIKYSIDEIWVAEDAIEASETEMGL